MTLSLSLTALSTQGCVVRAQHLLALRKFSFVASRLKDVGCSCFIFNVYVRLLCWLSYYRHFC